MLKINCKTCKGAGQIEFERGAVTKPCLSCYGTGHDFRAERDALAAELAALKGQRGSQARPCRAASSDASRPLSDYLIREPRQ